MGNTLASEVTVSQSKVLFRYSVRNGVKWDAVCDMTSEVADKVRESMKARKRRQNVDYKLVAVKAKSGE